MPWVFTINNSDNKIVFGPFQALHTKEKVVQAVEMSLNILESHFTHPFCENIIDDIINYAVYVDTLTDKRKINDIYNLSKQLNSNVDINSYLDNHARLFLQNITNNIGTNIDDNIDNIIENIADIESSTLDQLKATIRLLLFTYPINWDISYSTCSSANYTAFVAQTNIDEWHYSIEIDLGVKCIIFA